MNPTRRTTVGAIIRNSSDQILLQRRSDDGFWSLPGGGIEAGETVLECLEREILEETGWKIMVENLLGIYSNPIMQMHTYPDGNRMQFIALVFEARALKLVQKPDSETLEIRFFDFEHLPERIHANNLEMITDAFTSPPRPFIR
jgi:ADP-ribose pyrophosphatase YjhB (NUDIX family)